jgi:hypothetical protein
MCSISPGTFSNGSSAPAFRSSPLSSSNEKSPRRQAPQAAPAQCAASRNMCRGLLPARRRSKSVPRRPRYSSLRTRAQKSHCIY